MHAEGKATIKNRHGFHVRPSSTFAAMAGEFSSAIKVKKENGPEADGKAIMGLMTLGAAFGNVIAISADGDDAEEAVKALIAHVEDSFGGIE